MFNRKVWEDLSSMISVSRYPSLPCPYCDSNNLKIDKESIKKRKLSGTALTSYMDKFHYANLKSVKNEESDWLKLFAGIIEVVDSVQFIPTQFIAFFKCSMCNESVSATGVAKEPTKDSNRSTEIKVENFSPPIPMFPLRPLTPKSINEELLGTFSHYHSDIFSSGNKLRRAMEKLCEELGFTGTNLHRKIEAMAKEYPQEAKWLEPLKLVGNEATHSNGINESDLLDSLLVFEVVLDIFRRKHVESKVAQTVAKLEQKFKKT